MIVALMQKYTREKRMKFNQDSNEEFIQFRIFRIKTKATLTCLKEKEQSFMVTYNLTKRKFLH